MSETSTSTTPVRVAFVSLGCPKNLVDSENLLGSLDPDRFALSADPAEADVAVVNTCAFLEAAREEAIETILEMARLKTRGDLKGVVVAGCIVTRHADELRAEIPEVDEFLAFSDYATLPDVCLKAAGRETPPISTTADFANVRLPLTLPHTGYLKVSEGCGHSCSFCLIPKIRGGLVSRSTEDLLAEVRARAEAGTVELNLIGQDLTEWGRDRAGPRRLPDLLHDLAGVDGIRWLRLMYAYPALVSDSLMREMAENDRVVKYLDMPVQHAAKRVLARMKRGFDSERLRDLIRRLRATVPGLVLRTTVLVGHPGETEDDFEELLDFLRDVRFDHLGAFTFSPEDGTDSATQDDAVPVETAAERYHEVMALQQEITFSRNRDLVGETVECIVDGPTGEPGFHLGRTFGDAPDIDGTILIKGAGLEAGGIGAVRVTGADGYDLEGDWQPGS